MSCWRCWLPTQSRTKLPTNGAPWSTAPPSSRWSWPRNAPPPRSSAACVGTWSRGCSRLATSTPAGAPRGPRRPAHGARKSLRLARRGGATRRVASYRNLGAFRLLLEVQNPVALARFVDETLGPLLRYQEGRRTPLIETLEQLSAEHWNRRAAARGLHLHVNSLSYRIQRCDALLGVSLTAPETRVSPTSQ